MTTQAAASRRSEEIATRLGEIDTELTSLRRRMADAFSSRSDAPGANILIASIEQRLGHATAPDVPTLGQVQALEQERDTLEAERARLAQ